VVKRVRTQERQKWQECYQLVSGAQVGPATRLARPDHSPANAHRLRQSGDLRIDLIVEQVQPLTGSGIAGYSEPFRASVDYVELRSPASRLWSDGCPAHVSRLFGAR
jgi:hypothetical protein